MISYNLDFLKTKHGIFHSLSSDLYIGNSMKLYGEYSEIELSIIMKFITEGDYVFDIGANIGAFTIPFLKKIGRSGKVFSFEPQKEIFEILKMNIKNNKKHNIELFQAGLGLDKTTVDLTFINYNAVDNFGGISLVQDKSNPFFPNKSDLKQKISIMCLDQFLHLKKCNFIKIDVEGMEPDVINGGKLFLNKFRPIMWIENHRVFPNKLNKLLLESNYNLYWALSFLFNPENYLNTKINHFPNICSENILAIPKEKNKNFDTRCLDKIIDEKTAPRKVHPCMI